ncbi:Hypothetical predicted protein [Mytilus galloprovincialis]|uniref:Uncharacterized protein n=1 Tax=Mytilus galloprovincialis TaxID=29158 RepID=A0A8B6FQW7_MYTGA|nr:Hypothetical predicted protein [Mytilus galloprovincialis]
MVLSSSSIVADSEQDDDHGYACVDPLEIFGTAVHGAPEVEIVSTTDEEADGKRLNSMCGAQVLIKIKSEKEKTKSLSLPTQTTYRTVTTQVGSSLVQPSAAPKTVEGTPKKKHSPNRRKLV